MAPSIVEVSAHQSNSLLPLVDRYIDDSRPLRVAVIGGGVAGILAGILLPAKVPNLELTIFEKNKDFGGTWLENIYPGVRCDTPSHAYQATFCHKTDWSGPFPPGSEILKYWQSLARKYAVYNVAKFKHKVEDIEWNSETSKWIVNIRKLEDHLTVTEEFDFAITCVGRLSAGKLPDYPGIKDYRGVFRHTSNWDPDFDCAGRTVAVIGNGASAVQVVPPLQKVVSHLYNFARSKTWVGTATASNSANSEEVREMATNRVSLPRTDTLGEYVALRKETEDETWRSFQSFLRSSDENTKLRDRFTSAAQMHLKARPDLLDAFTPSFPPNCRRQTQGPGYLEAITAPNVTYVTAAIERFTEGGIQIRDGTVMDVDAVFCATGFETDCPLQFSVKSNGQELRQVWGPGGQPGFPYTYLGISTPGFPNLLFMHGPHSTSPSGPVPHSFETQLTYMAKLLRKVSREGIKSVDASSAAANDFMEYADIFFATTVLTDGCRSSYKRDGPESKIHGFWPGSAAHLAVVRREPRWEDWNYEHLSGSGNRFSWYFGHGLTRKEGELSSDMTGYLQSNENVDLRGVHESWWQIP